MKLQDKHREFAVKCYAKFMNSNATIVFQLINYSGGTRKPRTTIRDSLICAKTLHTRTVGACKVFAQIRLSLIVVRVSGPA